MSLYAMMGKGKGQVEEGNSHSLVVCPLCGIKDKSRYVRGQARAREGNKGGRGTKGKGGWRKYMGELN